MTIIAVVTTILTLLALLAVPKVNAQKPVHFDYPHFDEISGNTLIVLNNASIVSSDRVLKLSESTEKWCLEQECVGLSFYSTAIEFIGRNSEKTSSFSSSFVFSLTAPLKDLPSEGLLFFLTATNPYDLPTIPYYSYYGLFPLEGQSEKPIIAVEFDTLENDEIDDIDDNHVGVDLSQAKSASQESCYSQNISLVSGDKIKTWIEYHDPVKTLEIRLAYWDPDVVRPAYPLLTTSLDLTTLVKPLMYVGFASRTSLPHLQDCAIYSWSFHSKHESRALSKRSKTIAGSCVGVLAVIVALAACFCLGPYSHKKSTEAAKAQKGTIPLSEQEIRVDFPVPASPREDTGFASAQVTDSSREEALVPHTAALPAKGDSGDGRGNDAGSGLSDTVVYQDPSSPGSFSVKRTAKTSKSWSVWRTGAGPSPDGRSFGRTGALTYVEIQRTKSSDSGHNTREMQVVVKKSETLSPRNREVTSPVRSQVSSTDRSPLDGPRHASPLAGDTIMYTNTLYDSSPLESRGIHPRQRPLFPGSHERSTRRQGGVRGSG